MDANFRFILFVSLVVTFGFLQWFKPLTNDRETFKRALCNLAHSILSQALLFLFFYSIGKTFFDFSEILRWGVFYQVEVPAWLQIVLVFVVFDLALYLQHRASHRWAWFWKLHRMHHSDGMLTTSTAVRFHFLEIFVSAFWKGVLIILLGASFKDFVWFEAFLSSCALFNHSNMKIYFGLNKFLETFLFTPELHRIHHSTDLKLCHSNFGFSVTLWDRLFKTFTVNQKVPEVGVTGLKWNTFWKQLRLK